MIRSKKTLLVWGAALSVGLGCTAVDAESGSTTPTETGGASSTSGPGTGGAAPANDSSLFEWTECFVPEEFRVENYRDDEAEGDGADGDSTEGDSTKGDEEVSPPSLQVGDGDLSVLVVFDKSGSMGDHWGDRSRFWAAHDALMRGVHRYIDNLTLSAILFPLETSCGAPGLDNERQIPWVQAHDFVERWDANLCRNQPSGSTPLLQALEVADHAIDEAEELGLLEDRFRVLVLTDGDANCGATAEALVAFPQQWANRGVETHVIGLPGSEGAADVLRRMAEAGGGAYTPVPRTAPVVVYGNDGMGGATLVQDETGGQDVLTGAIDVVVK